MKGHRRSVQSLAYDLQFHIVAADRAIQQYPYRCIECKGLVHVKQGEHKQPHYFHLSRIGCRTTSKSREHWEVQFHLKRTFTSAILEHPFTEIGRIADCYVPDLKLVIEVQCSPIPVLEMRQRTLDYESRGLFVLWILHTKNFKGKTVPEFFLRHRTHYHTSIDAQGHGHIFDRKGGIPDLNQMKHKAGRFFFAHDSFDRSSGQKRAVVHVPQKNFLTVFTHPHGI